MMNVMIILAGIGGSITIFNAVVGTIRNYNYYKNKSRNLNSLRYVKYERRA